MPIKWTPEIDQILLLKILETSDVSPKCGEIVAKWPAGLERPTPRAISERIFKIRALAKASGNSSHFSVPTARTNPGTPRKNATNGITKKSTPKKTNGTKVQASKRKRNASSSDYDASDDLDDMNTDNDATDAETPNRKKSKANTTANNGKSVIDKELTKVKSEEEENGSFPDDNGHHYEHSFGGDGAMEMADYA